MDRPPHLMGEKICVCRVRARERGRVREVHPRDDLSTSCDETEAKEWEGQEGQDSGRGTPRAAQSIPGHGAHTAALFN